MSYCEIAHYGAVSYPFGIATRSHPKAGKRFYKLFKVNSSHPSLHFKPIHTKAKGSFYSVRIGIHYRALALREKDELIWFWIGSHADYDALLAQM